MRFPYPFDKLFAGQTVRSFTDARLTKAIIDSADRASARQLVFDRAKTLKLNPVLQHETGSGFDAIVFQLNNKQVRLTFKPILSGTATKQTERMEACQCVYLACYQANRNADTDFVHTNYARYSQYFDVGAESVDELFKYVDRTWKLSHETVAKAVTAFLRGGSYVFHHDSQLVHKFYDAYRRLNREIKSFSGKDKWNPADIWAVKKGTTVNLDHIYSFDELNDYLRKHIDAKTIVPISLKQMGKTTTLKEVNTTRDRSKPKEETAPLVYERFRVNTGKKDWTSSKRVDIVFKKGSIDGSIVIRSFDSAAQVRGTLDQKRSKALHGKIGFNDFIKPTFQKIGNQTINLPPRAELNKLSRSYDVGLATKVTELANKLDGTSIKVEYLLEQLGQEPEKNLYWLADKYEGLLVIEAFSKMSKKQQQQVTDALHSRGSASQELSGPFIKTE